MYWDKRVTKLCKKVPTSAKISTSTTLGNLR